MIDLTGLSAEAVEAACPPLHGGQAIWDSFDEGLKEQLRGPVREALVAALSPICADIANGLREFKNTSPVLPDVNYDYYYGHRRGWNDAVDTLADEVAGSHG